MRFLAFNLLLAIFWMFLTGTFWIGSLGVGFIIGLLILFVARPVVQSGPYVGAVVGSIKLLAVYFYKLVAANLQLARDILRPTPQIKGGFIRFDARGLRPPETVFLGNMVSLTPGTLTVDADDDGHSLYIHTVYAQDPEQIRRSVQLFADLIHGVVGPPLEVSEGEGSGHGTGTGAGQGTERGAAGQGSGKGGERDAGQGSGKSGERGAGQGSGKGGERDAGQDNGMGGERDRPEGEAP